MKRYDTFLYKNICISLFLKRSKLASSVREKDRNKGCRQRLTEDCYIDPFLIHVVTPYSGPYVLASLTKDFQQGSTKATCLSLTKCLLVTH